MPYFTYILQCSDGSYYTGITTDIERRITEHNAGTGAKYTRTRTPVICIWQEEHADRSSASRREYEIKRMTRKQKEALIAAWS